MNVPTHQDVRSLVQAFRNCARVTGLTHAFYKYPARFSPSFAAAAMQTFSSKGDVVLDPFMGGATTIVEGMRLGRRMIGSDINSLAIFLGKVKTSSLTTRQASAIEFWADGLVPALRVQDSATDTSEPMDLRRRNLDLPDARYVTRLTQAALATLPYLPDGATRRFARCILLNAGQWALHGRRRPITAAIFRNRVSQTAHAMLRGLHEYMESLETEVHRPQLVRAAASELHAAQPFKDALKVDLVVTSPPYPGIHILYHRWQVNGRRETPAPYWITDTHDGQGSAYYNLGDRRRRDAGDYFDNLEASLASIRRVMRPGAMLVELVAFANPRRDLPRYLATLNSTGFSEVRVSASTERHLWRRVPGRAWHASLKGDTASSREVLLLHRAS